VQERKTVEDQVEVLRHEVKKMGAMPPP